MWAPRLDFAAGHAMPTEPARNASTDVRAKLPTINRPRERRNVAIPVELELVGEPRIAIAMRSAPAGLNTTDDVTVAPIAISQPEQHGAIVTTRLESTRALSR
jgi:hypothetical protein